MALIDNIVAHWKLNEVSGVRADSHTNSYDLSDNNTVLYAAGKIGNASDHVAASNEFLNRADNADLSMGDTAMAFAGWVFFDSLSLSMFLAKRGGGGAREYEIGVGTTANRMLFRIFDGTSAIVTVDDTTFGDLSTGTWYFFYAYHDPTANTIGLSINNGTVQTGATGGTAPGDTAEDFRLGTRQSASLNFDGRLDSISVWKKVLAAQEVTDLYNGGAGFDYPFSVAAGNPWNFYAQQ